MAKIDACCDMGVAREEFWNKDFNPVECDNINDFDTLMGHEIALQIKLAKDEGRKLAMILPVGSMGMYKWAVYFLTAWKVDCKHVYTFNMDEWADGEGNTLSSDNPASFEYSMNYASEEEWKAATYRISAKLHPLTIEQNALTSFKSRTTLVPCRANTIGPGLFLQADYIIGGADGTLGFVDMSEHIDTKLEMLNCHESQIVRMREHDGIDFPDMVKTCCRYRGFQCGAEDAEGFRQCQVYLKGTTKRLLP